MNIATETYIKEALMNLFQRVSSNGPGYIKTAEYRRKVDREEDRIAKGELGKTAGGLLPVEYEEMKKRKPLCMEDLRLALVLGDSYLGQVPLMAGSINMDRHLDAYGIEEIYPEANPATYNSKTGFLMERTASGGVVNGVNGVHAAGKEVNGTNGWVVELNDLPAEGYGEVWQGAEVEDMGALDDTLDNILGGLVT
jgi:transcriptional coactivator HFI1/ADA1